MSVGNRGGRRFKPTALHKLHGTGHTTRMKARAKEPQPVGDLQDPPDWFDKGQQDSWNYVMEHCPKGLLKLLDRGALVLWVEAENRHREASIAQSKLNQRAPEAPYLVKGPDGLMMSPYVEIIDRAAKVMIRMIGELGFSPAARPRIKMPEDPSKQDTSPWARLRVISGGKAD